MASKSPLFACVTSALWIASSMARAEVVVDPPICPAPPAPCNPAPPTSCASDSDCISSVFCYVGACVNDYCDFTPRDCDDGDPCTIDSCSGLSCNHVDRDCDNGNICTDDQCVPDPTVEGAWQCIHPFFPCPESTFCAPESCNPEFGACAQGPAPCPGQLCDEPNERCVNCLSNADCDLPLRCNTKTGECVECVGVGDCPGEVCEQSTGTCQECVSATDCLDGVSCHAWQCAVSTEGNFCNMGDVCANTSFCNPTVCDPVADACVPESGPGPCDGDPCSACDEVANVCIPDFDEDGDGVPNCQDDCDTGTTGSVCKPGVPCCDPGEPCLPAECGIGCSCEQCDLDSDGVNYCDDLCHSTPGPPSNNGCPE